MVNQQGPQKSFGKETVTKITDINGDVVLEIGLREYIVNDSNGRTIRRISETIQLVDGMAWNPGMTKIHVGVCQQCRKRTLFGTTTHGLIALHKAKKCDKNGCGELLCLKHARRGWDNKWRCIKHHREHMLKNLFRPLFYKKEEE